MRKLLFAFALLMLCVSAASAEVVATVTGDKVRIRAEPSTKSAILTEVNKGFNFEVIDSYQSKGEAYPWYKGVMYIGTVGVPPEGWVYGQFLSIEGARDESVWSHSVTFTNMTKETVSLAVASEGGDRFPGAQGWYAIEAGETAGVTFQVSKDAIGPGQSARCYYYAKSESKVWGGNESVDLGYVIHPAKDFWCVRGEQGNYGEAGGAKYDYAQDQPAPEDCEYVAFKELPRDGDSLVSKVIFKEDD